MFRTVLIATCFLLSPAMVAAVGQGGPSAASAGRAEAAAGQGGPSAVSAGRAEAAAGAEQYEFDRGHTRIFFELDHMGYSSFRGMFHDYEGSFVFDEKDLGNSRIDVTIDMASADMYFEKMNEHLLNADILDVKRFPKARFVSTEVKRSGEDSAQVTGNLSMHGETKPVTLSVQFNKASTNPLSKKFTRGFTATGVINRVDFGIDYAVPLVGRDVLLTISVEAYKVESKVESGDKTPL